LQALHGSGNAATPVYHTWRLNERHYGALTGRSKQEAEEELGKDQLLRFRRGFEVEPPVMDECHPYFAHIYSDTRYQDVCVPSLPRGESLKQCFDRVLPYWEGRLKARMASGKRIIVSAHNNVLRCLVRHIDGMSDEALALFEIPTGVPMIYHLDETFCSVGTKDQLGFSGTFLTGGSAIVDDPALISR